MSLHNFNVRQTYRDIVLSKRDNNKEDDKYEVKHEFKSNIIDKQHILTVDPILYIFKNITHESLDKLKKKYNYLENNCVNYANIIIKLCECKENNDKIISKLIKMSSDKNNNIDIRNKSLEILIEMRNKYSNNNESNNLLTIRENLFLKKNNIIYNHINHNKNSYNILIDILLDENEYKKIRFLVIDLMLTKLNCSCFIHKEFINTKKYLNILNLLFHSFNKILNKLDNLEDKYIIEIFSNIILDYIEHSNLSVFITNDSNLNKISKLLIGLQNYNLDNYSNKHLIPIGFLIRIIKKFSNSYKGSNLLIKSQILKNLSKCCNNYLDQLENVNNQEITSNNIEINKYLKKFINKSIEIFSNLIKINEFNIELRNNKDFVECHKKYLNIFDDNNILYNNYGYTIIGILNRNNLNPQINIYNIVQNNLVDLDLYEYNENDNNTENKLNNILETVNSFKNIPFNQINNEITCSICLCNFIKEDDGNIIKLNECNHLFHKDCISNCLRKTKCECPNCRQPIKIKSN